MAQYREVAILYAQFDSDMMKVKEEHVEEQAGNHTLMAFLINIKRA